MTTLDPLAPRPGMPVSPLAPVPVPRRRVLAWALWDWGGSAFNAVATTFVFTVYLTSSTFGDKDANSSLLGLVLGIAGVLVALTAPVTGQQSDASGRHKLQLGVYSAVIALSLFAMGFVFPQPGFLWLGLIALAVGTLAFELASVNYNALITHVSTEKNVGRVSGFGWSMGYFGGIVLLAILLVAFVFPKASLLGLHYVQWSMLVAGLWFVASALPLFFAVPENPVPASVAKERVGFFGGYVVLFRSIARIWRESRNTIWFLLASAIFRDGLTGVFTFGGVIAAGTFGFSDNEVIIFAIAANIVAGVATVSTGALDDRFGPKAVILASLVGLLVFGLLVFFLHGEGAWVFWVFGLFLCLFVGPAQSASRSFLARVIPEGREGEVFGLYATTGRAATFIAPLLFSLFVAVGGAQIFGVLGILVVIAVGLGVMIPVSARTQKLSR